MLDYELIHRGSKTDIFISKNGNATEIIKVLKTEYPSEDILKQFNNEYELTKDLATTGIRKVQKTGYFRGRHALWMEYVEGECLNTAFRHISIEEFVELAIKVVDLVGALHESQIIHKDLNPYNILYNLAEHRVYLIDFGLSSKYDSKQKYERNPNKIEGNLYYIAPEQTGRMNRSIDFRSDIYSLGFTFYEVLTKQLPFNSDDAMELIHSHIAKNPPPPSNLRPDLPEALEGILYKMMSKNPEERYKSAKGLLNELQYLQQLLEEQDLDGLKQFRPGQYDFSEKLQIPEKLYGREREIEILVDATEKMAKGEKPLLFIGGQSGSGKSFLVHEVHKIIRAQSNYYFIEGKFDQHQRNLPYSAWIQAFQGLTHSLLTLEEEKLSVLKQDLLAAIGSNAGVLTEVIPSLTYFLGEQEAPATLSGIEAQNRFNYIFQQFIRTIVSKESPLIIFIDDLQWADLASLQLLKAIVSSESSKHLLLIGAYRSNETDSAHPFIRTVEELAESSLSIEMLELDNLSKENIEKLLADTTARKEGVNDLAALIYSKTDGNAFFVNQFIYSLHDKGLLFLSEKGKRYYWDWDLRSIQSQGITSNVVELMVDKVKQLPSTALETLKPMACLGNKTDLATLSLILEKEAATLDALLDPAFRINLLFRDEEQLQFTHDRIQQAVYTLLSEKEKQKYHLQIAQHLQQRSTLTGTRVFDLANQYNQALPLIEDTRLLEQVGLINLEAGKQAKASSAYTSAQNFLQKALNLLSGYSWKEKEQELYELHRELADTAYLNGNFEESEKYVSHILKNCHSGLKKAEVYNMLIVQHTFKSEFEQALKIGTQALERLKEPLPTSDLEQVLGAEIQKMMGKIGDRPIHSLIDEPEMTDEEKKMATQLLVNLIPVAYLSGQMEQYAVISAKIINLALEYGHSPASSHGYSNYGGVVAAMMGQYEQAYQFGELALNLTEKFNNMYLRCKDSMLFANFMSPWVSHVVRSEPINREGFKLGLESGELQYPGYISMFLVMQALYRGDRLQNVNSEADKYIQFTNKTKHQWVNDGILMMKHGVLNLMGETSGLLSFSTEEFDEVMHEDLCFQRSGLNSISFYHILKGQTAYLYGKPEIAVKHLEEALQTLPAIAGMIITSSHNFYYSLALLQLPSNAERLAQVRENQEQMEKWVNNCPENFLHKKLLVDAEVARVQGNQWKAFELYKQAIDEARKQGFLQNEALAHELIGEYWHLLGYRDYAGMHLNAALRGFESWGAIRKAKMLRHKHDQYLRESSRDSKYQSTRATEYASSSSVDIYTLVKAVETLTTETNSEDLLDSMVRIVVENAGAQKGIVLLPNPRGKGYFVKTSYHVESGKVFQFQEKEQEEPLLHALLNLAARSKEQLVVHDAQTDLRFSQDEYVLDHRIRSILCMPMINGNRVVAMLYLENNLTAGAFRSEHLQLLNLLSTQIAISIENTELYENLEEKVEARTRELQNKNKHITASINYARRIQQAILPPKATLLKYFKDTTLFFKPRDIVSGDFYWFAHVEESNKSIVVAADCTGHGVPGAFMSMIGDSLLNRAVYDQNIYAPDELLRQLHQGIQHSLNKRRSRMHDGMDAAIVTIDHDKKTLSFAGAKNPLIYMKDGQLSLIKGSKFAIGDRNVDHPEFALHELPLSTLDQFYLISDGYQDQFGGEKNRKFMIKRLKQLLLDIHTYRSEMQEDMLERNLYQWMAAGKQKQIDDILILGVKL